MAELPEGEIIRFYKDSLWNAETGRSVRTEFAEIRFDNGPRHAATRVYLPVSRLPASAALHGRVRWADHFGGRLELLSPAWPARRITDVTQNQAQEPLF